MSVAIGNSFCAPAAPEKPATGKSDEAAKQQAEAQAKAEQKAAQEREAAKAKHKDKDDEVPKGFNPEAASANLAALLSSTLSAI